MSINEGRYEKYTGQETEVILPDCVEGNALAVIGCKAFLSCKTVERLVLPFTLEAVEDWGFAHMKNLREILLPAREIQFGRQVFLGCENLQRVILYSVKKFEETAEIHTLDETDGLDRLRASMFRFFPRVELASPECFTEAAGQKKWLARFDEALEQFLRKPDEDGFVPAFIGWFDVEDVDDVDDQKQGFIVNRQKDKVLLVFQRLLCGEEPEESLKTYLHSVLRKYPALVQELLFENPQYGQDIRYYRVLQQAGALERSEAELFLNGLPWEEPEIRAYLMELINSEEQDFFAQLEL